MSEETLDWDTYLDFPVEDVPALQKALDLANIYPALRHLVGIRAEDLVVRASVLHAIHESDKTKLTRLDLDGFLYYLNDTKRDNAIENLKDGGWIQHSESGWVLTPLGTDLYNVLLILFSLGEHPYMEFSTLLFGVIKRLQGNPEMSLRGLLRQMQTMTESLHEKLEMRSSLALDQEAGRAKSAVKMANIALDEAKAFDRDPQMGDLVQELHTALSHLVSANFRLTEALAEIAKAHVALPAGYTPYDILKSLSECAPAALERVGEVAHLPTMRSRLDLHEDEVCARASAYINRERFEVDLSLPDEEAPTALEPEPVKDDPHLKALAEVIEAFPEEEVPLLAILGTGPSHQVLHRFYALDLIEMGKDDPLGRLKARITRKDGDVEDRGIRATNITIRKNHAQ